MKKKIKLKGIDGVIFDLDGVITDTATIHKKAWKVTFDNSLKNLCKKKFSNLDYYKYIDGKPRLDGISIYLKSRRLILSNKLIKKISNEKNILFKNLVKINKIILYKDALNLIKLLKINKIKIGLASSSKNCKFIIKKAKIYNLFDYIIDGQDLEKKKLKGKPNPKIFLEALKSLNLKKDKTVIIEDSASGVKAAFDSNVKFPVGICRKSNSKDLKKNGARIVLKSLNNLLIQK
jgi:alpha,alpha-trehalase